MTGGAVLWCPGRPLRYFGYTLEADAVGQWVGELAKRQVIGQAELHPVCVAKRTWREDLRGRRLLVFIDNNAAKDSLVRAYSPLLTSARLIADSAALDGEYGE